MYKAQRGGRELAERTLARLELALGWQPGSAQRIIDGGGPAVRAVRAGGTVADEHRCGDRASTRTPGCGSTAAELRDFLMTVVDRLDDFYTGSQRLPHEVARCRHRLTVSTRFGAGGLRGISTRSYFRKGVPKYLARRIRDRAAHNSGARVDPADDDVIHPLLMHGRSKPRMRASIWSSSGVRGRRPAGLARSARPVSRGGAADSGSAAVVSGRGVHVGGGGGRIAVGAALSAGRDAGRHAAGCRGCWRRRRRRCWRPGMYGILEGWLAVDGARDWWPMRPPPERDEADFGWDSGDLTLPGLFDVSVQDEVGERTPLRQER